MSTVSDSTALRLYSIVGAHNDRQSRCAHITPVQEAAHRPPRSFSDALWLANWSPSAHQSHLRDARQSHGQSSCQSVRASRHARPCKLQPAPGPHPPFARRAALCGTALSGLTSPDAPSAPPCRRTRRRRERGKLPPASPSPLPPRLSSPPLAPLGSAHARCG